MRSRRSATISLLIPLALVGGASWIGMAGSASLQAMVTLGLCNLVVVLGLQMFIGNSGVYSFGQLAFAAIGAYVGALMTLPAAFAALQTPSLPHFIANAQPGPVIATLIAAALCGALALIVGLPLMRTSTLAIPISTFAFLIVVYNVLANWDAVSGGSAGLVSIPKTTGTGSAAIWAAAAVVAALAFKWSASGYRLQATREDEVAARSIGISVMKERLIAFGLSAVLCGIGGSLAAHQSGVLTPASFYFGATVTTLTMLVLGGGRSVLGAVIGTIAVSAVNEALNGVAEGTNLLGLISIGETPGLAAIGLGAVLLVTMIALPNGISGGREAGELRWLRGRRRSSIAACPLAKPETVEASHEGALRAEGISVAFAGLQALHRVDLNLAPGEIVGLIGPNGAGKTTLVNVLSGFQRPDAGRVLLDGQDVTKHSPAKLARAGVARTFQAALPFPQFSALDSVAVGAMGVGVARGKASARAEEVLARLGIADLAAIESGALPPGQQRLLGIGRALAAGPRYLMLDEPAAGLNEEECEELVETLAGIEREFRCSLLLIEHDMDVVMGLCARVQVLEQGATLRVGAPGEIQSDPAVAEAYLGSSYAAVQGA